MGSWLRYDPTIMLFLTAGNTRRLAGATLVVLLGLVRTLAAAETDVVCKVSTDPSKFDHQQITLKGIVTWLRKGTSRGGRKEITFFLTSFRGVRRRSRIYSRGFGLDPR
jgi:hypothetical protein